MATLTARLTIEDFEALPQDQADYKELVEGELIDVPGNNPEHNLLRGALEAYLAPVVRQQGLALVITEQEYRFGEDAHGPDFSFFGPEKVAQLQRRQRVQPFIPDLAIEIASANDGFSSLYVKARKYRRFGVAEVWILDPVAAEGIVFRDSGDRIVPADGMFQLETMPGVAIPMPALFSLAF
jgi:Uma2 family endonuclease